MGHFKILAQACPEWGDGINPEFFVSSLYISVAIKVRYWNLKCLIDTKTIFPNWFSFFLTSKLLI